jgi:hypothetical protein
MSPRVRGSPPQKENISPALADPGDTFWPGPRRLPAQSKRLLGRLHAQESARLAFDPPQASFKLLPIKWSRGLDALFPRLKSPAAEAPSFGYFALRESELFAGGFDTLRETSFFGHSCSGNSSFITLSGRIFAQEVYAEA